MGLLVLHAGWLAGWPVHSGINDKVRLALLASCWAWICFSSKLPTPSYSCLAGDQNIDLEESGISLLFFCRLKLNFIVHLDHYINHLVRPFYKH